MESTHALSKSNFSGLGVGGKQRIQNTEDKTHFEGKENGRRKWAHNRRKSISDVTERDVDEKN